MADTHLLLVRIGELLHYYGTPSYRLEGVLTKVASSLNIPGVFLYTPTALHCSLGKIGEQQTYLKRIAPGGEVDIAKLLAFDEVLEQLEAGKIPIDEASLRIESIAGSPPPYSVAATMLASAVACLAVASILGGGAADLVFAAIFGVFIEAFMRATAKLESPTGWSEPVIAFLIALSVSLLGRWLPLNVRLVTLAALILPIPGLTLTIAITELALSHLSAGTARLAGATSKLLAIVLGVAIAWRIVPTAETTEILLPLPEYLPWAITLVAPLAFAVVFRAPLRQWPVIVAVCIAGFTVAQAAGAALGPEMGALLGAFVVGCSSNIYARVYNRPAMVPQTPALLILVPGSIGYRALTAMIDAQTLRGMELAFSMVIIAAALAGGLLLASLFIPPKRFL
ncbi:MAG: threonine/serine exporter ThrE family protein [Pirellulaceae bacterium]